MHSRPLQGMIYRVMTLGRKYLRRRIQHYLDRRRKEENPVIPPNRYLEYAPRAPSHSARAHSPKGNEPHNHLSSKLFLPSENRLAAA